MLILPAYIEKIETRKDKTWKVVLGTQELSGDHAGALSTIANTTGFFAFKAEPFNDNEEAIISEIRSDYDMPKGKSPAQRLRNVLYILFKQNSEGYSDFNLYYSFKIEQMINFCKDKLD